MEELIGSLKCINTLNDVVINLNHLPKEQAQAVRKLMKEEYPTVAQQKAIKRVGIKQLEGEIA